MPYVLTICSLLTISCGFSYFEGQKCHNIGTDIRTQSSKYQNFPFSALFVPNIFMYNLSIRIFNRSLFSIRKMCSATNKEINCSRLKGKVAVVTASTDGIGFAIAKRLAIEGAKVVVSSRKINNVESAVTALRNIDLDVHGVVCHVSKAEDRKKLYEEAEHKYGGIDILVSNAAVNPAVGPVLECDEQSWDKIFDVNVKSSFLLAKEVLPYLRKRGGGSIVFISSIAGLQPFPILGAYSVSKTALFGLTKAASQDLATENIRVNCLAPGIVRTRFSSALHENESSKEAAISTVPMRRLAEPSEMSGVVAFMVSDDASYMTGEVIVAAGGMPSRL